MSERIKLHRNIIRAIEHLSYDCGMTHEEILENHTDLNVWKGKAEPLMDISYKDLKYALYKGYVVNEDGFVQYENTLENKVAELAIEEHQNILCLEGEMDSELAVLNLAIKNKDHSTIDNAKKRLAEIHQELGLGLKK